MRQYAVSRDAGSHGLKFAVRPDNSNTLIRLENGKQITTEFKDPRRRVHKSKSAPTPFSTFVGITRADEIDELIVILLRVDAYPPSKGCAGKLNPPAPIFAANEWGEIPSIG
jgi:hypothetical protein